MRLFLLVLPLAAAAAVALWSRDGELGACPTEAAPPGRSAQRATPPPQTWDRIVDSLIGSGLNKSELVRAHCGLDESDRFAPRESPELRERIERLGFAQRDAVESVSRDHRDALLALASNAMDELQIALAEAIDVGAIEVAPLQAHVEAHAQVQASAARRKTTAAYSTTFTVDGWLVSVTLDSHTSPNFAHALHAFSAARQAHDEDVLRALEAL